MSLGLPEFGTRGPDDAGGGAAHAIRVLGYVALSYALLVASTEWRSAGAEDAAREKAKADVGRSARLVEETRRALQRNPDVSVAAASVESSPARVTKDLNALLPDGVSIPALKIDYSPEGVTRLDITVVARSPQSYDRFLNALSKSMRFADIKPGAEIRPGLVRATLTATHRPDGSPR